MSYPSHLSTGDWSIFAVFSSQSQYILGRLHRRLGYVECLDIYWKGCVEIGLYWIGVVEGGEG
jgi:hypothetical protein